MKLSICVPIYNGASFLPEFLDSLVSQMRPDIEIILCDDRSKDTTFAIAQEYAARHPFIHAYQNKKNLGMDRNFVQSTVHAQGEYIWLSGQDDIFRPGTFQKFFDILNQFPKTNFIYFNYQHLNGDLSQEIAPPQLSLQEDFYFNTAADYFSVLDRAPSFLPATVMRRRYFTQTPIEDFLGSHYVQVGIWLRNFSEGNAYVVANPNYIVCRIPDDSWKNCSGQMLFEIFSGSLDVYSICAQDATTVVPVALLQTMTRGYLKNFLAQTLLHKVSGFKMNSFLQARLRRLFGQKKCLYWGYIYPIANLPLWLAKILYIVLNLAPIRQFLKTIKPLLRRVWPLVYA